MARSDACWAAGPPKEGQSLLTLYPETRHCYVCGAENPIGMHVRFEREGEHGSVGEYTAREEHCGWPGILHGGVAFALMDEALAWALYFQNLFGVTGKCETRFRQPIRCGMTVTVHARTLEQRRNTVRAEAAIRLKSDPGVRIAEANALMFLQPLASR